MEDTSSSSSSSSSDDSDHDNDIDRARRGAGSAEEAMSRIQMEDLNRTRKWLNTPCRREEQHVQCYVTRQKSSTMSRKHSMFRVFMENTNEFIMAGRKRVNKSTSNYLITMDRQHVERSSHMIVGKVRSNISGSIYHVYDQGLDSTNAVTDSSVSCFSSFFFYCFHLFSSFFIFFHLFSSFSSFSI